MIKAAVNYIFKVPINFPHFFFELVPIDAGADSAKQSARVFRIELSNSFFSIACWIQFDKLALSLSNL